MRNNLFEKTGAHVLVDGQFGSTGKGALAAWLAAENLKMTRTEWAGVISNAGPNSGHTFYHGDEKHVLKQLPSFAVASHLLGNTIPIYLSAGAIIDYGILEDEANRYPDIPIFIHPNAALLMQEDKEREHHGTIAMVAGTRSGTGEVLARKVKRDQIAIIGNWSRPISRLSANVMVHATHFNTFEERYFVEVSQGFSLGINQRFYPKCTSRECTVMQAIADAGIPPRHVTKTYMSIRTFPIRVGNVDGYDSGGWYPDQKEITWEELGVEPELTTVTQRVRRVATFSDMQFRDALRANDPDFVFCNFMNYVYGLGDSINFTKRVARARDDAYRWFDMIEGYGPKTSDIKKGIV